MTLQREYIFYARATKEN